MTAVNFTVTTAFNLKCSSKGIPCLEVSAGHQLQGSETYPKGLKASCLETAPHSLMQQQCSLAAFLQRLLDEVRNGPAAKQKTAIA